MYDNYGKLIPGFHDWSLGELQQHLVNPFPSSVSRPRIIRGFERLRSEMTTVISEAQQWVNGSFATQKLNPGDMDLLNIIDKDAIDNLSLPEQTLFISLVSAKATQGTHDCDSYFLPSVPDTHPDFDHFRRQRKYWMGEFGFDRDDSPKGIVRLELKNTGTSP